jgi:tetratricopeptide (TPR) repeat protein
MKVIAALLIAVCTGCTTISQVRPDFTISDEDRVFSALTSDMTAGKYADAVVKADQFQEKYPYSLNLQKARFHKAEALEGLNRWQEAADTYTAISTFSKKTQPEIAAQSVYRLSFVYEALNDYQRVLTSLFEAQRLQEYLPPEVGLAEIPARLAMAYTKENNPEEAQHWLVEAEKGLKQALESRAEPMTDEWLAKMYFNMGSVSTNKMSMKNAASTIHSQEALQKYLIKAMQYNHPIWSASAGKRLRAAFADIWAVLENPVEQSSDTKTSAKESSETTVVLKAKKEEQFKLAGPFLELIEQALLFEPAVDQPRNAYQLEFFTYLHSLKPKVNELLQDPLYTPLIRRSDKASPKHQLPANIPASEDPN